MVVTIPPMRSTRFRVDRQGPWFPWTPKGLTTRWSLRYSAASSGSDSQSTTSAWRETKPCSRSTFLFRLVRKLPRGFSQATHEGGQRPFVNHDTRGVRSLAFLSPNSVGADGSNREQEGAEFVGILPPFSLYTYKLQFFYMVSTKIISKSKKGLSEIAQDILYEVSKEKETASLLALYGNLGSGKTTFTQEIAKILGITEHVTSPTFILEKIYKLSNNIRFSHLIHIDAYRIENIEELHILGWDEIIKQKENFIIVEWADKIENALPENTMRVYFKFIDEEKREIQW